MNASSPQLARYLVLLTAAALAFFSIGSLTRLGVNPDMAGWIVAYAFIMLVESGLLVVCYFRLPRRNKGIFWMAAIILALNVILPIFDQIGLADVLFILLNLAALTLLYSTRKDFLPA
ncbi:MAG: hypothetical protein KPEEDBHJ_02291 [Anaerolineales bacterium]|nr:hypothetical protein [Anaerolineales bacterium]